MANAFQTARLLGVAAIMGGAAGWVAGRSSIQRLVQVPGSPARGAPAAATRQADVRYLVLPPEESAVRGADGSASGSPSPDAHADEHAAASMSSAAAAAKERHRTSNERVRSEPVDSRFASTAKKDFTSDFAVLQQQGMVEGVTVDCRTSGCVVDVRLPEGTDEVKALSAVVHNFYTQNCLIDVAHERGTKHVSVVFDKCGS